MAASHTTRLPGVPLKLGDSFMVQVGVEVLYSFTNLCPVIIRVLIAFAYRALVITAYKIP